MQLSVAEGPAPCVCGSDRTGAITYATFTAACCSIDMFAVARELWSRSTDAISLETCPVRARLSPEAHTHCAKERSRGVARQASQRLRSGAHRLRCQRHIGVELRSEGGELHTTASLSRPPRFTSRGFEAAAMRQRADCLSGGPQ